MDSVRYLSDRYCYLLLAWRGWNIPDGGRKNRLKHVGCLTGIKKLRKVCIFLVVLWECFPGTKCSQKMRPACSSELLQYLDISFSGSLFAYKRCTFIYHYPYLNVIRGSAKTFQALKGLMDKWNWENILINLILSEFSLLKKFLQQRRLHTSCLLINRFSKENNLTLKGQVTGIKMAHSQDGTLVVVVF